MKKAVIFDMDGVLVDSEPYYLAELRHFLNLNHIPIQEDILFKTAGASSSQIWQLMAQMWDSPIGTQKLQRMFHEMCADHHISYSQIIFPQVIPTLKKLKSLGVRIALASSSSMDTIHSMLMETKIKDFFEIIVSGQMFAESKPNPEIYLYTLEQLKLTASDCIAVEDSTYGILAAKRSGIEVAAIYEPRFQYDQSVANYIIQNVSEIFTLSCMQ